MSTDLEVKTEYPSEAKLIAARRDLIAGSLVDSGSDSHKPKFPSISVALSGGGIRSATFSLGVIQALAQAPSTLLGDPPKVSEQPGTVYRNSLLSRLDYLSTVSGGGYAGGFLMSLFQADRLRPHGGSKWAAADDTVRVLSIGSPGRIRSDDTFVGESRIRAPLAWLRDNGRYLVPTGVGDALYASAVGLRNWMAVHYVIGTILLLALSALVLLRASLASLAPHFRTLESAAFARAIYAGASIDGFSFTFWWSTLFWLALAPILLWTVPVGIAFWFPMMSRRKTPGLAAGFWNWALFFAFLIALAFIVAASLENLTVSETRNFWQWPPNFTDPSLRQGLWLGVATMLVLSVGFYANSCRKYAQLSEQRVHLTRSLSYSLLWIGAIVGLALVDTLGQSFYLSLQRGNSTTPILTPAALVTVIVWLTKKGAASFSRPADASLFARLPLATLGGLAGIVILFLVASLWSLLINWLLWNGQNPEVDKLFSLTQAAFAFALLIGTLMLAWITGWFPTFINLSSLQSFYSARLTRAYLGATNGERFERRGAALSAAEPLPNDNLSLNSFYTVSTADNSSASLELSTLAPLHIINVTLNKTVDPAEQLVQRDRKGLPLAILPFGFSVDGKQETFRNGSVKKELQRPLGLGEWMGTSGAAFSTGIGRETSLGMSLLMGAANVRLGTWWDSGQGKEPESKGLFDAIGNAYRKMFRTQTFLLYEFRARFFGMNRRWQYLSDGGHFENTALYELLRPSRQVKLIIASDNGADPKYSFGDLANLIRLARIDLGVELSVASEFAGRPELAEVFGCPRDFMVQPEVKSVEAGARKKPTAILLRASLSGEQKVCTWIVLLKPSMSDWVPADIQQYAHDHPVFPQESTTDQFFDEAQWESYRSLGYLSALRILDAKVFKSLLSYIAADAPNIGDANKNVQEATS